MKRIIFSLLMLLSITSARASSGPATFQAIKTVFVILEENENWDDVNSSNMPYLWNTLLPIGGYAKQYYNPPGLHPSEPNYIWIEAGDNFGLKTDAPPFASNSIKSVDHLVTHLDKSGISWKTYQEGISGTDCPLVKTGEYVPKHNPFIFFQDVTDDNSPNSAYCIAHMRPVTELAKDLARNTTARYNFITPNMCNDMHDTCSTTVSRELTADHWLKNIVPQIMDSQAYKNGGAIFITWDEGEGKDAAGKTIDGPIGMIILSPLAKVNYSNSIHYTHSSLLRTLQEIFGIKPLLRDAASATSLSDFFVPFRN